MIISLIIISVLAVAAVWLATVSWGVPTPHEIARQDGQQ